MNDTSDITQRTSKDVPPRPTYGYTGRYTNPPFMCPINGWLVDGKEVDRDTTLKAFERYADALEKRCNAPETRAFPQAPDTDERYNVSDGLLETLIEVAQDNGFRDVVEALRELQVRRGSRTVKASEEHV